MLLRLNHASTFSVFPYFHTSTFIAIALKTRIYIYHDNSYQRNQPQGHRLLKGMSCTGLGRYVSLAGAATSYARRITRLRNRILGEVARPTSAQSEKVVSLLSALPRQKDPEITNYYPRHIETYQLMLKLRNYGLFRDEHEDFKEEMKRLRVLRGKAKPKKGEGKRASKK